ncbi:unnamed protein product [Leptidea sinapis]|uniref:DDE Tnp4 domain-containing protein n=1 Tax=Leptidea sinapis TaxID=189913 RepID=A0A5E4R7P9_9NEOP|nr:unnamed protein product [Leptidea sinapis]
MMFSALEDSFSIENCPQVIIFLCQYSNQKQFILTDPYCPCILWERELSGSSGTKYEWPYGTANCVKVPQTIFNEKYGFPGICGCNDCTHIAIVRPQENEERFFNRKHFHSINCQVICEANCKIISIDASYGGNTHDSFIWQNSEICDHLESLTNTTDETAILLGS